MTDGDESKNPKVPEEDSIEDIEAKAQELRKRIAAPGTIKMPDVPEWDYKRPAYTIQEQDPNGYKGLGMGITIAYALAGSVIAGVAIGWGLDKLLHQNIFIAIFGLLGSVFGIVATFILLSRSNSQQ